MLSQCCVMEVRLYIAFVPWPFLQNQKYTLCMLEWKMYTQALLCAIDIGMYKGVNNKVAHAHKCSNRFSFEVLII